MTGGCAQEDQYLAEALKSYEVGLEKLTKKRDKLMRQLSRRSPYLLLLQDRKARILEETNLKIFQLTGARALHKQTLLRERYIMPPITFEEFKGFLLKAFELGQRKAFGEVTFGVDLKEKLWTEVLTGCEQENGRR